jgi:S1-C subfamily serine protease
MGNRGRDKPPRIPRIQRDGPAKKDNSLVLIFAGGAALAALAIVVFGILGIWLIFRNAGEPHIPLAQDDPPPVPQVAPVMEGTIPVAVLQQIKDATVFVRMDAGQQSGTGSGFLMRVEGDTAYFATNDHVVTPPATTVVVMGRFKRTTTISGPKARISVVLRSGTPREQVLAAEVVTADADADLAVLRVTGARDLPRPIDFSQNIALVETMPLFIFGFPFGKSLATNKGNPAITVGKGAISSLRRNERDELTLVQINGDLNPGNSGGPVVDAQGRLIGVSVAAIKGTQIGMAIPAPELTQLLAGRALGSMVFKKKIAGNSADVQGEVWTLDRFNKIKTTRALSTRLNNVAHGGGSGEFEIEAMLLDPLKRISKVALLCVRTDNAPQAFPNAQGRWDPLPGAQQLPLRIEDQRAIGGHGGRFRSSVQG